MSNRTRTKLESNFCVGLLAVRSSLPAMRSKSRSSHGEGSRAVNDARFQPLNHIQSISSRSSQRLTCCMGKRKREFDKKESAGFGDCVYTANSVSGHQKSCLLDFANLLDPMVLARAVETEGRETDRRE